MCYVTGHSNVVAFVTHGGLNGVWQAIYHATPLVVMPIFADNFRNAHMVRERQIGEAVDFDSVTEDTLTEAISSVVENSQ